MAKRAKPPPLGRLMSVSLWRNLETGEADGSVLISADLGYGAAKLRLAAVDVAELIAGLNAIDRERHAVLDKHTEARRSISDAKDHTLPSLRAFDPLEA